MAGRHSFAKLRVRMAPEAQARALEEAGRLEAEVDLAEVRRPRFPVRCVKIGAFADHSPKAPD
jgi:hypothetical protein